MGNILQDAHNEAESNTPVVKITIYRDIIFLVTYQHMKGHSELLKMLQKKTRYGE